MIFSSRQFFHKTNERILLTTMTTCFRSFFGRNRRYQKSFRNYLTFIQQTLIRKFTLPLTICIFFSPYFLLEWCTLVTFNFVVFSRRLQRQSILTFCHIHNDPQALSDIYDGINIHSGLIFFWRIIQLWQNLKEKVILVDFFL